eukprot:g13749.t1
MSANSASKLPKEWSVHISRSTKKRYIFNSKTNERLYNVDGLDVCWGFLWDGERKLYKNVLTNVKRYTRPSVDNELSNTSDTVKNSHPAAEKNVNKKRKFETMSSGTGSGNVQGGSINVTIEEEYENNTLEKNDDDEVSNDDLSRNFVNEGENMVASQSGCIKFDNLPSSPPSTPLPISPEPKAGLPPSTPLEDKFILHDFEIPLAKGTKEEMDREKEKCQNRLNRLFVTQWFQFKRLHLPDNSEISFAEFIVKSHSLLLYQANYVCRPNIIQNIKQEDGQYEKLKENLQCWTRSIINTSGDGNCLLHALIKSGKLQIPVKQLRRMLVQELTKCENEYIDEDGSSGERTRLRDFVCQGTTWQQHLKTMAKDGEWCDQTMLWAASRYLRRPIVVVSSIVNSTPVIWGQKQNTKTMIVVGHIHEFHYVATRLNDDTGVEAKQEIVSMATRLNDIFFPSQKSKGSEVLQKMKENYIENRQFENFDIYILVPNINSLYNQTVNRVRDFIRYERQANEDFFSQYDILK